ncbi:MAG: sialidase family protein [Acidobacteriota bacterium]
MKFFCSGLLSLCLIAGNAIAQSNTVVRISDDKAIQPAEVSIAINPTNPDNLIGVSFQYGRPGGTSNFAYVTKDGGKTWKTIETKNVKGITQGDDVITFDSQGAAHHAFIAFTGIRVVKPKRAVTGIIVNSSRDGGLNWDEPVPAIDHINSVTPFEDKPAISTDRSATSKFKNNIYLAWTRFDEYQGKDPDCKSHIFFTGSSDGGRTFAMPFKISDTTGDCADGDNTLEGAVPAVGINGEVYVVWAGAQGLYFDKSMDGGLNFGKDKIISDMPGGWDIEMEGISRANGMPVTKVDTSNSPHRGTIYVNWVDTRNGDTDVFLISSKDGGASWTKPLRVNDDPVKNGKAQFFTWMAVDPVDGSINIIFYDRRDLSGTKTGLTMARSVDGGKTFVNHKVNIEPFECNQAVFFGDYSGIDAYGGLVTPIFMHFVEARKLAVSAAIFRFKPGTQETVIK